MAKTEKKSKSVKSVKSLKTRNLSSKQARGVKGGLLPAVNLSQANTRLADGSVRPVNNVALNFNKV